MSPSETQQPQPVDQQQQGAAFRLDELRRPAPVHTDQPKVQQAMDPERPHPEPELRLRGGDRGGCCPGRFCFCIPCPIPCDCCIIPL